MFIIPHAITESAATLPKPIYQKSSNLGIIEILIGLTAFFIISLIFRPQLTRAFKRFKKHYFKKKNPFGFSIIEMVIVILILTLVVIVTYPYIASLNSEATLAQENGIIGSIRGGLQSYYTQSKLINRIPTYPQSLDNSTGGNAAVTNPLFSIVLSSPITKEWSKSGQIYTGPTENTYSYNPENGTFQLTSIAEGNIVQIPFNNQNQLLPLPFSATTIGNTTIVDGIYGEAMKFDGIDSVLQISHSDQLNLTDQGTLEAWINMEEHINFAGIIHKGSKRNFSDETYTWQFWNNNRMLFGLWDENNRFHSLQTNTQFLSNQWYHVVATWDDSGMKTYINGQLDSLNHRDITARQSQGDVYIGAQYENYYNPNWRNLPFNGIIDEARIYNRALAEEEIHNNYQQIAP